jgi:hypothetical protein
MQRGGAVDGVELGTVLQNKLVDFGAVGGTG